MKLLVVILLGALVGASGYTFYYARGLSYLSDDPRACVNCHIMREHYDGWQKASHHAHATCNACHVPRRFLNKWLAKAKNGWQHSRAFTLQDFHEPIRIKPGNVAVLNANCVRCHRELVREITARRVLNDEQLHCVRCHDSVGHGPRR
ncbi:MAG: cytochrome c nitrite reductase small subunit [Verrucomicrobiae bacterium]|nr:cytochrome c nitrite reductase small subunit [Verrucomicrobiae bacterium]